MIEVFALTRADTVLNALSTSEFHIPKGFLVIPMLLFQLSPPRLLRNDQFYLACQVESF